MAERRVTVGWAEGLHARPASLFVKAAMSLGVPLTIARADGAGPVNAASVLGVLGLAAGHGQEVVLSGADGTQDALDRLARMVAEGLDTLPDA